MQRAFSYPIMRQEVRSSKMSGSNAASYSAAGGGKALIDNFTSAFGSAFDSSVHKATDIIGEGEIEIAGIRFIIKKTAEAFDIGIPEINAVYTHMLGHDCHSIIGGKAHAQMMIDELNGYLRAMSSCSHRTIHRKVLRM